MPAFGPQHERSRRKEGLRRLQPSVDGWDLLLNHLDLALVLHDRVVLIAGPVALQVPELPLCHARRIEVVATHAQMLQRDQHLVLAEPEEATEADRDVLPPITAHDHIGDFAKPLSLGAIDHTVRELRDGDLLTGRSLRLLRSRLGGPWLNLGLLLLLLLRDHLGLLLDLRLLLGLHLGLHLGLLQLLLLCLLARHLLEADLWLALGLLELDLRLAHLLDPHLRLLSTLDGRLDLFSWRLDHDLGLRPLDLHLRLLLWRSDGDTRLRHIDLHLRLRHLHTDLRLRHAHGDLRLLLLNRYRRRWHANRDLRLGLTHGDLRLRLLHPDPRSGRCELNLRRLLLHGYPRLLLARLLGLLLAALQLGLLLLLQAGLLHLLQRVAAGLLIALRLILPSLLERQRRPGWVLLKLLDQLVARVGLLGLLLSELLLILRELLLPGLLLRLLLTELLRLLLTELLLRLLLAELLLLLGLLLLLSEFLLLTSEKRLLLLLRLGLELWLLLLLLRTLDLRKGRRDEGRRPEKSSRDECLHFLTFYPREVVPARNPPRTPFVPPW